MSMLCTWSIESEHGSWSWCTKRAHEAPNTCPATGYPVNLQRKIVVANNILPGLQKYLQLWHVPSFRPAISYKKRTWTRKTCEWYPSTVVPTRETVWTSCRKFRRTISTGNKMHVSASSAPLPAGYDVLLKFLAVVSGKSTEASVNSDVGRWK